MLQTTSMSCTHVQSAMHSIGSDKKYKILIQWIYDHKSQRVENTNSHNHGKKKGGVQMRSLSQI